MRAASSVAKLGENGTAQHYTGPNGGCGAPMRADSRARTCIGACDLVLRHFF